MKQISFLFIALLFSVSSVQAQRVRFELQIEPAVEGDIKVYVIPLTTDGVEKDIQLREKDGKYVGGVTPSEKGLYSVYAVYDNRQLQSTIHAVPDENNKVQLAMQMQGYTLMFDNTSENRALSSLNMKMNDLDRALWTKQGISSDSLRLLVEEYGKA